MSEILGVLFKYLLAAFAIVAVLSILYEAISSNNTSTAISDLTQIQARVYQLCSGESSLDTLTTPSSLLASGILPHDMLSSSSSTGVIDTWGGTVKIQKTISSGAVTSLTFPDVPLSACTKLTVSAAQVGTSVTVGSSTAYPSDPNLVSEAATNCTAAGTSTVPMTFNFYPNSVASSSASSQQ